MLATFNLSDVKYIDEQDESDYDDEQNDVAAAVASTAVAAATAERIRRQQQQQQQLQQHQQLQWQSSLNCEGRRASLTVAAGALSDAAWLLSPCVVDRSDMAMWSPGYASLSRSSSMSSSMSSSSIATAAFEKPKQLIRTGSVQLKPTPSLSAVSRQESRITPPRTLQIQPCVDRSIEWKHAASSSETASAAKRQHSVSTGGTATSSGSTLSGSSISEGTQNFTTGLLTKKDGAVNKNDQGEGCVAWRKFVPRHDDEIFLETGDPVDMEEEYDDLWCKGLNVRTGQTGVFPSVCLTDEARNAPGKQTVADGPKAALSMESGASTQTFVVRFLGSVEAKRSSGIEVLVEAVRKVTCHLVQALLNQTQSECGSGPAPLCRLTVSPLGVHLNGNPCKSSSSTSLLSSPPNEESRTAETRMRPVHSVKPCHEGAITSHFFPFKNITYSGRHPENSRYLGFITKHPTEQRHACHCLAIQESDTDAALVIREILMQRLSGPTSARSSALSVELLHSDISEVS